METLTKTECINVLYTQLQKTLEGQYNIIACVTETTINSKYKITFVVMPNKQICASNLFRDSTIRDEEYSDKHVGINTLYTVYNALAYLVKPLSNKADILTQDKVIPDNIESIKTLSFFNLSPYGINGAMSDNFLLNLLFSTDTIYYEETFKTFINTNKFLLFPPKQIVVTQIQKEFQNIVTKVSHYGFNSNPSVRTPVFIETYDLFSLFLVVQRYIFTGIMTIELDDRQNQLLDTVKLSANPWNYIKDAIAVLLQEETMLTSVDAPTYKSYTQTVKKLFLDYTVSHLETPSKQLVIGEIKL